MNRPIKTLATLLLVVFALAAIAYAGPLDVTNLSESGPLSLFLEGVTLIGIAAWLRQQTETKQSIHLADQLTIRLSEK